MSESTTYNQLTLFAEDSLASLTVWPGSDEARQMTATSGRNIAALLPNSDPLTSLVKMCLVSEQLFSTLCYLTWKTLTTPGNRLLFQLAPSMPPTEEIGFLLWPTPFGTIGGRSLPQGSEIKGRTTPTAYKNGKKYQVDLGQAVKRGLLPTPKATDGSKGSRTAAGALKELERGKNKDLGMVAALWPTPTASTGGPEPEGKTGRKLVTKVGGALNPQWVEWLMGFPVGWTDLEASETP